MMQFWLEGAEYDDPEGLREVVVELREEVTHELAVRIAAFLISQLVRLREQRPYLRVGWGARHVSVLELHGEGGAVPRRQLLAVRLAGALDTATAVIVRDTWAAPVPPARSFVRIAHVRQDFRTGGPKADYLAHDVEAVTILLEGDGSGSWVPDEASLLTDLAARLEARPVLFRTQRWTDLKGSTPA